MLLISSKFVCVCARRTSHVNLVVFEWKERRRKKNYLMRQIRSSLSRWLILSWQFYIALNRLRKSLSIFSRIKSMSQGRTEFGLLPKVLNFVEIITHQKYDGINSIKNTHQHLFRIKCNSLCVLHITIIPITRICLNNSLPCSSNDSS